MARGLDGLDTFDPSRVKVVGGSCPPACTIPPAEPAHPSHPKFDGPSERFHNGSIATGSSVSLPGRSTRMHSRALRAVVVACGLVILARGESTSGGESAAESSTRRLLEALDERQMPDVMLWVIDRAEADPDLSPDLKRELPFLRATALVGTSRTEPDGARRAAILDEAATSIDAFLAVCPEGDRAIAAYTQKANLLIERGRGGLEQAKRPGQDATKLSREAAAFFDAAIACLQGTVTPDQKEIPTVANAEDAVIKSLREANAEIDAIKATAKGKAPDGTVRLAPPQQKEVERLGEIRDGLQAKLLSTRIMTAATVFEKSKAFPADSKEARAAIAESTAMFKSLAEKYPTKAAGTFARYYWGRNEAAMGGHEAAIDILAPVVELDGTSPLAVSLRAKAAATTLECWLALAAKERDPEKLRRIYSNLGDDLRKFALTPADRLPGRTLDGDWLALKYRTAAMLDGLAASLDARERQAKGLLQRDAKKLATEVATVNRDFAKEARDLAARLGKDLPVGKDEQGAASLVADGRLAYAAMQEKQATAKRLLAEGKTAEAAEAATLAAADRDAALKRFEEAIAMAEAEKQPDEAILNSARSMLAFLLYDAGRLEEAAAVGGMLAEQFPNAAGSRQAAKVALASLQQLASRADSATSAEAKARLAALAVVMTRVWATEAEGADAFSVLLNLAIDAHDAPEMLALLARVPRESPRRAEFVLRAGTALRREAQEARKMDPAGRPDEATLAAWNEAAKSSIDEGLAMMARAASPPTGPALKVAVSAALARAQMALEDGDRETAGRMLEHESFGPWTVVRGGDPALAQGPIAAVTLTVALRHFIETEQFDKAEQAMDALERAAGAGEEASAKLTAMYLSMGRDLQSQLESLGAGEKAGSPEVRDRAAKILTGFEKFLAGVAGRDRKISSQLWVATTYLTLGSGTGTAGVVSKSKAEHYLDRAAEAYAGLLARRDDPQASETDRAEIARFEPSIRLKLAGMLEERGKWDEAQEQLDWILADPKRQNTLDIQVRAAALLEAAGRAAAAAGDMEKADTLLREAASGRQAPTAAIWGWGGIANRLSRQAFAADDERAMKAREQFFDARLRVADTLFARATLVGRADRQQRLETARTAITMTRKLYPDLGGPAFQRRFEKLLEEIQREEGTGATP